MREIRFRGKSTITGKWAYGDLVHDYRDMGDCIRQGADHWGCGFYAVDPATIGQFTGLLDKNGIEIYEGDILRNGYTGSYGNEFYENGLVCYSAKNGRFEIANKNDHIKLLTQKMVVKNSIEVVSNIHDNKEAT